jgi:PAS domain S-box-containing protein
MATQDLRARAERAVHMTRRDFSELAALEAQEVLHELQVHQVELEMQNESLRLAQLDLERSSEQYRQLFDHAPVGYLILDAAGAVQRANTTAVSMLGVPRIRLLGQPFAGCVAGGDLAGLDRLLTRLTPGTRNSWEVRLRLTKAGVTHVRIDTSVIAGVSGCMVVLTDISDRVRSLEGEQRLHLEREADLAGRIAALEAQNRTLEAEIARTKLHETQRLHEEGRTRDADRLQSLGMLAAGIAHDFNNLLVGVLGNADLLLQTPALPEAWREPLTLIKRAGRNASDLTRQLLVFAGLGRLSMAPTDFSLLVSDALDLLRSELSSSVVVKTRIDPDLPAIMADRGQVHQVVMNLVTNAIEALGGRGEITIRLREVLLDARELDTCQPRTDARPGGFVSLQVQDSGPGIDAATQVRIFDPFFTTKFTGRGLGLATALGIVQSHHGTMRVRSKPGHGAIFEVAFPLAETPRESEVPVSAPETAWFGSGSVLLIDDDVMVRKVVSQLLERLGYEVTVAESGDDGLEKFRSSSQPFDFVVLDWLMPGTSGEQVLNALRALEPELAVILVSGYSIEDLAKYDRRAARVQKPMTLADLQEAMSSLKNRAQADYGPVRSLRR